MPNTVTGKVHVVEETKTFGQKGFRKRIVVLEKDDGRFTSHIPLEFIQDGCDTVNDLKPGDEVEVQFTLGGRKWQRDAASEVKYFLSATAVSFRVTVSAEGSVDAFYDAPPQDDVGF